MRHGTRINLIVLLGLLLGAAGVIPASGPLLWTAQAQGPAVLYVKPAASGDGGCSDWDNACTLQTALGAANAGDEIWVAQGVYRPTSGISYASCQEIRDAFPDAPDGDYLIGSGGNVFQVYCADMDSTPVEYLSLWNPGGNFSQYTAGGASPGTDVRTWYSRVRLLPDTLQVDISDQRYASSTGSLTHGTTEVTSMPYGVAMDCITTHSAQGKARIDLRHTPFVVSDTFQTCGYLPGGDWTFSAGDQVVDLAGGGYCGWMQPAPECLATPYNDAGGAQPILELGFLGPERRATFQLKNGVALYGGFAGTETSREERDPENNLTVLSGDIAGDDLTDPFGVVTDTANIVGFNAWAVVTGSGVTETAVLDGFTVSGGNADGPIVHPCGHACGGGMYNDGGSPTLTHVTFSGNTSASASCGGMFNTSGSSPTLTDVTFSGNTAGYRGGGMCNDGGSPTLTNVTFSGNRAPQDGGGMFNLSSSPTVTDVTFSDNTANDNGGGMYNISRSPTLRDVTFSGNTADYGGGMVNTSGSSPALTDVTFSGNTANVGGGMYNYDSSPALTDVTFSGNAATDFGGGMFNYSSSVTLTHCTVTGNTADLNGDGTGGGGGIYREGGGSVQLKNTIVAGNGLGAGSTALGPDLWGEITSLGYNLVGNADDATFVPTTGDQVGSGAAPLDPLLADLALNPPGSTATHALLAGSPALDWIPYGANGCGSEVTADQRGVPRPFPAGGACDVGAYEVSSYVYLPLVLRNLSAH